MDKITLILIWTLFFFSVRKKIKSGVVYFVFLACMCLPVSLIPGKVIVDVWFGELNQWNMVVFALCIVCGFFPWLAFDSWVKNKQFYVQDWSIRHLKVIFTVFIVCSLFSIIYLAPYAVKSATLGASEVRLSLKESLVLPPTILTTFAVAVAGCHIFAVSFFFIACLTPKLKAYRVWLVISSLTYVVSCAAITARDGLIILPCLYVIFYLVFRHSLNVRVNKEIKKRIISVVMLSGGLLLVFSLSRFYDKKQDVNMLYSGTIGYISQQPYVFNATIEDQDDYWGFERSFPLLNRIMGVGEYKVKMDKQYEWSFGTMYSEFYSAYAWPGLILISLVFVIYYTLAIRKLSRSEKSFGLFMIFPVYLFIVLTGMFYMRAGNSVTLNIFYATLSILPFLMPKYLGANVLNLRK